jgi:Bacterial Ig-like domain/FG-GAP-like repeat/FlgD Ig-like domain
LLPCRPGLPALVALFAFVSLGAAPGLAAPAVVSTSPANQAVGVPLGSAAAATFAQIVDPATVVPENVLVTSTLQGTLTGTVTWNAPRKEVRFVPDEPFLPGEQVTVVLGKGIEDGIGMPLANGYSFSFSTWTAAIPDHVFHGEPVTESIGGIAFTVTVADLDRDGLPEAIFSNIVPDSLTILTPVDGGDFGLFAKIYTGLATLPRGVAAGDLDGDGWVDLAVSSSGRDSVLVLRNLGGSGFAPPVGFSCGQTPYATWLGDLDADGDLDAATANFNGHSVSVLLNDGNGVFGPFADYSAGPGSDSPRWIDGADLDGDGDLDLVCCNGYSYDVSVMINDGNGVLTAQPTLYPVGDSPQLIGLRDFDDDALPDVVTVNSVGETMSFLHGNGDGTFAPAVDTGLGGSFPHGLQIADLDGDHDLDLVVPIRAANGWRPVWNDGAGNFTIGELYLGGTHCHTIGAADWDGDGDIDVLAGFAISKDAFLYGNASAQVPRVVDTSPARNATGVQAGSPVEIWFDTALDPASLVGDGFTVEGAQSGPHPALIEWFGAEKKVRITPDSPFVPGEVVRVTVTATGTVSSPDGVASDGTTFEFMTHGDGNVALFDGADPIALPGSDPVDLVAADFDGDGVSDLAVTNYLSGDVTFLYTVGGMPVLGPTVSAGAGAVGIWAGDLDGSGTIDVAVANIVGGSVTVITNDQGVWTANNVPVQGSPVAVAGGDFDLDGDDDLVVAQLAPDAIRILWNDGTGAFTSSDSLLMPTIPLDFAIADLDRDGDLDIVAVLSAFNKVDVITYDSVNGMVVAGEYGTGNTPVAIFPWDANGDGWIDLVTANYGSGGISVLQNLAQPSPAPPAFAPAFDLPSNDLPHGIWGADLTGEGMLDLVTANSGGADLSIFRNAGGGAFDVPQSEPVGVTPFAVVGGDWNADGRVDLAALNRTSGDLTVLINAPPSGVGAPALADAKEGLLRAFPSPFRQSVNVDLALERPGRVRVRVFDVRGRVVATLHEGELGSGAHVLHWSGTDDRGAAVASGVYFLRMDTAGRSWSRKVLRLR